jgi:alkanesulfonate monooxygenase SsuD/methylene tetrahydromethanopterin reductase-like flavin-dependent oxidoreductase (luciferase family)
MKVGLCLPVFQADPEVALAVAAQAEAEGLDGVFCFDHLFPMGRPDRPALSAMPVLAAVAQRTRRVRLGPLVSRVALVPETFLVAALATLNQQSEGRLIAGLGAGDRLSQAEHDVYGIAFLALEDRVAALRSAADALVARGIWTWVGGRSPLVRQMAIEHANGWNCWEGGPPDFEQFPSGDKELSWAGLPPPALQEHLVALRDQQVAWAVYAPAPSIDWASFVTKLAGAARAVQ